MFIKSYIHQFSRDKSKFLMHLPLQAMIQIPYKKNSNAISKRIRPNCVPTNVFAPAPPLLHHVINNTDEHSSGLHASFRALSPGVQSSKDPWPMQGYVILNHFLKKIRPDFRRSGKARQSILGRLQSGRMANFVRCLEKLDCRRCRFRG